MTLSVTPVDAHGIDNIAEGLSGFVDEIQELQQSMMTTLFISGASEASNGRCSYLLCCCLSNTAMYFTIYT